MDPAATTGTVRSAPPPPTAARIALRRDVLACIEQLNRFRHALREARDYEEPLAAGRQQKRGATCDTETV